MAKVCLIEDDAMVRKSLERVLRSAGHEVETAVNGRLGLQLVQQGDFDMVVTDIIMPEMEGIETIRRIREHTADLRIVAMSGGGRVGNTDFLKIAKSIGADEIVYKPVNRSDFLEAIYRCLTSERAN